MSIDAAITHSSGRRQRGRRGNFERAFMGRLASTVSYRMTGRHTARRSFPPSPGGSPSSAEQAWSMSDGAGALAIGFAPFCGEVVGVDPKP